jgi:protoporphyrinogen IX oxidase
MLLLLLTLHVTANLVWIGSITSVGLLLASAASGAASGADSASAQPLADAALRLYRRVATPAFVVSFVFGLGQVLANVDYYAKAHWFHGKVTFALAVIALHHVIGAKSKRAASGKVQEGKSSAILTAALLVSVFVTVLFAVEKTQLVR